MIGGSADFFGDKVSQIVSTEIVEVIQRILPVRILVHPTFEELEIAQVLNIPTTENWDENILGGRMNDVRQNCWFKHFERRN